MKELVDVGLLRSSEGCGVIKTMSKSRIRLKGDERILGDSDFVKEVLAEEKEQFERRYFQFLYQASNSEGLSL